MSCPNERDLTIFVSNNAFFWGGIDSDRGRGEVISSLRKVAAEQVGKFCIEVVPVGPPRQWALEVLYPQRGFSCLIFHEPADTWVMEHVERQFQNSVRLLISGAAYPARFSPKEVWVGSIDRKLTMFGEWLDHWCELGLSSETFSDACNVLSPENEEQEADPW